MKRHLLLCLVGVPLSAGAACSSDDGGSGWSAPALCSLPFDAGPCDAAVPVFAFADGACVTRVYGGCQGNENRFATLEQCMATCLGMPEPNGCTPDRVQRSVCLACGAAGGCGEQQEVCAMPCTGPTDCGGALSFCTDGVCQVGGCI